MKHHLNKALNENGSATDKVISRVEKVAEQTKGGIAAVGGGGRSYLLRVPVAPDLLVRQEVQKPQYSKIMSLCNRLSMLLMKPLLL